MGVGIFWIGLNRTDLGCWRLTLRWSEYISGRGNMSNFMGVGFFWIGLNRADLGCWRLTLRWSEYILFTDLIYTILFTDLILHLWKRRFEQFYGSGYFLDWSQPD